MSAYLVCAVVAGLALGYAVEEGRRLASGRSFRFVGRSQAVRRIVGSVGVALLMVLVYAGLELVDPVSELRRFVVLWTVTTFVTALLVGLALLDLRDLRANHERELSEQLRRLAAELELHRSGQPDCDRH